MTPAAPIVVAAVAAPPLLAQLGVPLTAKNLLILAGVVAIVLVILTQALGWRIPAWAVTVGWILLAVLVGILAINFLLSL